MGLSGLTIAFEKAEHFLGIPQISPFLLGLTFVIFTGISLCFGYKILKHPEEVKEEIKNPIKLSFFPSFSISLILLATASFEFNTDLSKYLWLAGTALHLIFTLIVINTWIQKTNFTIKHINPSWFIPVVGNILVPVVGVAHFNPEISWFFFSVGLIFWLVLFTVIFYRIIFYEPIAEKLLPTFAILIAPPAVGMLAYFKLTGEVDNFAKVLYYFALFLTILILMQIKNFVKLKFFLSWWAYSFPIASITIASFVMFAETKESIFKLIGIGLFGLLIGVILILMYKTILAIKKNEICVKE